MCAAPTKELSFGERKMLETARGLLIKELALAKVAEDKIAAEIDAIFQARPPSSRRRRGADRARISSAENAEPQVRPAPNATRQTRSPGLILPSSIASCMQIGIEAAVVLPYFWMLLCVFSGGRPIICATIWLMRRFAWCGMTMSMSSSLSRWPACLP